MTQSPRAGEGHSFRYEARMPRIYFLAVCEGIPPKTRRGIISPFAKGSGFSDCDLSKKGNMGLEVGQAVAWAIFDTKVPPLFAQRWAISWPLPPCKWERN